MGVFGPPSGPVFSDSSRDIKDFGQRLLDILLKPKVLFPRVKSSDCNFFVGPHPKVLYHSVENLQIFIISFFEVLLDLIRVIAFSHQTVSDLVDLIIAIAGDFISYILDIDLVPVFLFVNQGKSRLQGVQFTPFNYAWKVMISRNQMCIPFHQYLLLYSLQLGNLGTQQREQCPSTLIIQLISLICSLITDLIESIVINFEELVVVYGLYLVDNVVDGKSIEFKAIKNVSLQLMLVLVFLMLDISSFGSNKEQVPFPSNHRIFNQILLAPLKHWLYLSTVGDCLQPNLFEAHKNSSYQFAMSHSWYFHTDKFSPLFDLFLHFLFIVVKVIQPFLNLCLFEFLDIALPQAESIQDKFITFSLKHEGDHILSFCFIDSSSEHIHRQLTRFLQVNPPIYAINGFDQPLRSHILIFPTDKDLFLDIFLLIVGSSFGVVIQDTLISLGIEFMVFFTLVINLHLFFDSFKHIGSNLFILLFESFTLLVYLSQLFFYCLKQLLVSNSQKVPEKDHLVVVCYDVANVLHSFLSYHIIVHVLSELFEVFAQHTMSLLSNFYAAFSVFVSHKLAKELQQRLLASFTSVNSICQVLLFFFEGTPLIFEIFMHRLILLGCIYSFDGCESIRQSIEDKHVFDVYHSSKALIMTNSLSLQPHEDLLIPVFDFALIIVSSFPFSLNLFLIELDILSNTSKSPSTA